MGWEEGSGSQTNRQQKVHNQCSCVGQGCSNECSAAGRAATCTQTLEARNTGEARLASPGAGKEQPGKVAHSPRPATTSSGSSVWLSWRVSMNTSPLAASRPT